MVNKGEYVTTIKCDKFVCDNTVTIIGNVGHAIVICEECYKKKLLKLKNKAGC